jgi:hypothetical protein
MTLKNIARFLRFFILDTSIWIGRHTLPKTTRDWLWTTIGSNFYYQISRLEEAFPQRRRFIVNHEFNFIYLPIPKNACSSFKALILSLSEVDNKEEILEDLASIHEYMEKYLSLSIYSQREAMDMLRNNKYFKFCIVRNPWSRLTSVYCNKFVTPQPSDFVKDVINTVYQRNGLEPNIEKSITFKQFIEYLVTTNDEYLEPHWKPQYLFLGNIKFDFIGKFESLDSDFQYIKNKLNLPLDIPWHNKTIYNDIFDENKDWPNLYPCELIKLSKYPDNKKFYTPELVELVRKRYKKDIEMFEYEFTDA